MGYPRGAVTVPREPRSVAFLAGRLAFPRGGRYPPYTFAWENDPTIATRPVCPPSNANYSAKVSDVGAVGEIQRQRETAQLPLRANVLTCPDGGPSPSTSTAAPEGDGVVRTRASEGV